jgi:hypothetical protein
MNIERLLFAPQLSPYAQDAREAGTGCARTGREGSAGKIQQATLKSVPEPIQVRGSLIVQLINTKLAQTNCQIMQRYSPKRRSGARRARRFSSITRWDSPLAAILRYFAGKSE